MTWQRWLLLIVDGILIAEIVAYAFLFKALMWRYREARRMYNEALKYLDTPPGKTAWYVKGVDKVISRCIN